MNLLEILQDTDGRVANVLARSEKVRWLNQIQRRVFRNVNIPMTLYLETIAGQTVYPLDPDFPTDRIYRVTVDNVEYPYRRLDQPQGRRFYYLLLNHLAIEPMPMEDGLGIWVFYNKRPLELLDGLTTAEIEALTDEELQEVIPELPVDYHELYVLGLCEKIAKAKEDVPLANNYVGDFNKLLAEMILQLMNQQPEYPATRDVNRRGWR